MPSLRLNQILSIGVFLDNGSLEGLAGFQGGQLPGRRFGGGWKGAENMADPSEHNICALNKLK
jgi:hypothetical protein